AEGTGVTGRAPGDQRRSRRAQAGPWAGVAGSGLATVLRAFPAQRAGSSAAQGRRRLPDGAALALRPAGCRRGADAFAEVAAGLGTEISQALRVGGGTH